MFSRRHPFLFFTLIFSGIIATTIVLVSLLILLGTKGGELAAGERVGIIEIKGVISEAEEIVRNLKEFRENESIKAIVIRIDSPGGSVGPSQEIYRAIRKTIGSKKVIASMGAIAASGGYYIAAGANGIVANPGTITGSIGVIIGYTNFQELLKKIGLSPIVIKSGDFKDIGSPVRDMTDEEKALLQEFVDKTKRQFVKAIADGRKMDLTEVETLADGRIFTGQEAKELGLVDRLGNIEDAVEWAGKLGGIEGKIDTVYAKPKKMSWLRYLMDSVFKIMDERMVTSGGNPAYLYNSNSP